MLFDLATEVCVPDRPIAGRFLAVLLLLPFTAVVFAPALAVAQDAPLASVLTEEEAVRRALARPALADLTEAAVGIARSEAIRESLWPQPEIAYDREQTFGAQGAAQDYLTISQRFDLSGRRTLRSAAAGHRARATAHGGQARRMEIEAEVRLRFHELLAAQLRVGAIRVWVERIEGALATVSRREAAGDASAYDRRRLQRELANSRGRLAVHRSEADRAWARLAALVGDTSPSSSSPPQLSGALLPDVPQPAEQLAARIEIRPDILALSAELEAAVVDGKAASRWWVPELGFKVGWTGLDLETDRSDGYVAMAALSVPLFDRNQDEVLRAASEARLARGRRELALTEARGEMRGRVAELTRMIQAAQRFRRDAVGESVALIRTAEAGYVGDELGILELLDAYRGAFDDEMSALDLEFTTRRARIELDLVTGGNAP